MGVVFAPVVHRFLHRFHAEAGGTSPIGANLLRPGLLDLHIFTTNGIAV